MSEPRGRIVADGKEPGSVRAKSPKDFGPGDLRRAIERLEALPMRPASARQVLAGPRENEVNPTVEPPSLPPVIATDPAWAIERSRSSGKPTEPLEVLARHRWWPSSASTGPVAEALARLWRHSTAVSFAARRLAKDSGDADPEGMARAGLLHSLGLWALAAVSPEALVAWYGEMDPAARFDLERRCLGGAASSLGRIVALRWGCEQLVVDAAWLHADLDADLNRCSEQPSRLVMIQQAYAMASTTPWAPGSELARDSGLIDPRIRILTAEVQARCGGAFVELDSSPREERLSLDNAQLRIANARLVADQDSKDRFFEAFIESSPEESPETWANRAGLAWCGESGVATARVVWTSPAGEGGPEDDASTTRLPTAVIPLGDPVRPSALVQLWAESNSLNRLQQPAISGAWSAWAIQVADRTRLRHQFDDVVSAHRRRVAGEEPTRRRQMLEAMAEFAAGAGHELNNPLAVIVGRAQLLLVRDDDPESTRSLRAIIAQAQRAARILRDLMYVARPPEPRPRPCQPEEVVRACLRDLQADAENRNVRIVADTREQAPRVWADPEPLRQLADILTRNAMESTPSGGLVQFTSSGDERTVRWTIHDNGRGIGATEGLHLFDPFYCGRAAGRGLGLGLPRAARIIAQVGGKLSWQSNPGLGTTFMVTIPVSEIPASPEDERPAGPKPDRPLPTR